MHNNRKLKTVFITLLISLIILSYMKIWLSSDEYFTIEMIKRSYGQIIYVDSFDVHPPLYYILLKFFLSVILPFKHSVILIIIFARIFSVICSLITIHFLIKINNYFGIDINKNIQYFIFFLIPNVLFADNMNFSPSINIRMYALASLFVVMTMYFCLKFNESGNKIDILLITVFAELSAYTHYYAAVISGLFIFSYFVYGIVKKKHKSSLYYLLSGVTFFLLYIPWIKYGLSIQFKSLAFSAPLYKSLIQFVVSIIILLIFWFPFKNIISRFNNNKKIDLIIILIINLSILLLTTFYSILRSPIFLIRYLYPSLIIFEFISVCYCIQLFIKKKDVLSKNKIVKYSTVLILSCMPLISSISFIHEVFYVAPISINIYKNDMILSKNKSKYVDIDNVKYNVSEFDVNRSKLNDDTEYGLYLRSIGKIPFTTDKKRYEYDLTNKAYPSVHFVPVIVEYRKK